MKTRKFLLLLTAPFFATALHAQTVIENFEYASNDDLTAAWIGSGNAQVSVSDSVAASSTGQSSMSVTFNFPSTAFATETVTGPELAAPVSIDPAQYVSFRVKGDPAFSTADFRHLYLYAYDADGNFGRWGSAVPSTDGWRVVNYLASTVEQPWNSPALPDLSRITHFAFFQYGSEAAIPAYSAAINIDDLTVRAEPLIETPPTEPPAPVETVLETFEYASADELSAAWQPSANAVISLSDQVAALSPGEKALKVDFSFPSTVWATETLAGPVFASPVSIATNQFVTYRIKGDPAFQTADFRNLYLYAYDADGNFGRWGGGVPVTDDWQIINHPVSTLEQPWDSPNLPDLSRITRLTFFQYGSETAIPAYTATIYLDDIAVRNTALVELPVTTEFMIDDFEYATSDDLLLGWVGSANAALSVAEDVSIRASGEKSMKVDFNFPSGAWATETIRGTEFETPISIGPDQYITFRLKSDPAFSAADFRNLYLYAYDTDGNFGRWGSAVPTTNDWKVLNFRAGAMETPWDSPGLPNLNQIARMTFFQYGSEAAIDPYSASIYIDELMVRNSPLNEFPAPSQPRSLIEDFEGYPSSTELLGFYSYVNSPATTVTTAALEPASTEGTKALKMSIDFAAGQYPWGSVRSAPVTAFSFPTNGVLSVRFKGDPALADVADAGTSFWISFYDSGNRAMNFIVPASTVTNADWTNLSATLPDFGDTSAVDIGNLVQWRILVQGWEGTAESLPSTATFYVDDIQINLPSAAPALQIAKSDAGLVISWPASATGYLLESSATVNGPTWETVPTVGSSVTVTPVGTRFYRLRK